ncbi:MAG: hypothetical protein OEQ25_11355 [Gammaproteobacteria bacterium]|nr:hypothetical protein [Gammaproteobacteria bacterium]MDH3507722.1 hypothetical protein [Gammaproteobacteria bacterium]
MKPNKLDELRDILFRPDHEKLEALRARVEHAEARAADVAEVLPDSVAASFERDSRLVGALRKPLRECISESVREDPEEFADALFPIMGPAIRRSVAEAFKAWIQQANQAIEQSLSPRGLSWRFQAWRAGIPFGQYVLQRTLLYRVEHIYLIQASSGLLIGHVQQGDLHSKDEDAVSAMFTAIQEFVKDSFSGDEPQRLRTAELGELTLWAVHGPGAVLVALIRGVPPAGLRTDLQVVLERIETRFDHEVRNFAGERAELPDLEPELRSCLRTSLREPEIRRTKQRFSPALAVLGVLAVGVIAWAGYGIWMQSRVARIAEAFEATAGIVVTRIDRAGRSLVIRGLRDPMAPTPEEIAAAEGWFGPVDASFEAYLSLDRELVLARARAVLEPPDTVSMSLDAGTLHLAGAAQPLWISAIGTAAASVAGVERIDVSGLHADSDGLLAAVRTLLEPPAEVGLALRDGVLEVSGTAPKPWLDRVLATTLPNGVDSVDHSSLEFAEMFALRGIEREANAAVLIFDSGSSSLAGAQGVTVEEIVESLVEYGALAEELGLVPSLTITGHSDASGTFDLNVALERNRAETVASAFQDAGVEPAWIATRSHLDSGVAGARMPGVTLQLEARSSVERPVQD